jgi:serine/threonine protein kinase
MGERSDDGSGAARLGDWVLGPVLGAGDTSSVHLGRHVHDGRTAAIKVLGRLSRESQARFRREAEILESLEHPGVVQVYDIDLEDRLPYMVMEHVEGRPLTELLLDGPPPVSLALAWATGLAETLKYLHGRHIHHRDLCTSNLIIRDDQVVIVDFGLAKPMHGGNVTAVGTRFGSVGNAPPEWIGNTPVDGAVWDLYSLGVILYELLTGNEGFPVDDDDEPEHVRAAKIMALKRELPHLDHGPQFPTPIRDLVKDMTARDPRDRPKSAAVVLARLRATEPPRSEPIRPERPPGPLSEEFHEASRIGTAISWSLAVAALVVLLAAGWRVLSGVFGS